MSSSTNTRMTETLDASIPGKAMGVQTCHTCSPLGSWSTMLLVTRSPEKMHCRASALANQAESFAAGGVAKVGDST